MEALEAEPGARMIWSVIVEEKRPKREVEKRQAAIHQVKKEKRPRKSKGLKTVRRPPRATDSWATDARAPVSTGGGAAVGAAASVT
ncbi:hypothetical protein EYF80_036775 [Liparis tanakae]|uniref:Uncharacterized protein n=1 Tax=Liparis tanakae TaxID=230148 RepID=A0A4Z2GJP6_9TELE|nr:hypothetical protein EYF80_036775 [Liparis tanakae]